MTNTQTGQGRLPARPGFYDVYDNAFYAYDDGTFTTQKKSSSFKSLYHDNTIGGSLEWGAAIGTRQTVRAAFHLKNDYHQETQRR